MDEYKKILNKYYSQSIGEILSVDKLSKKTTNHLFKVETEKGKFFLKKLFDFPHITEDMTKNEMLIIEYLMNKKFPIISPIRNKEDKLFTKLKGNNYYLLYPYYELDDSQNFGQKHFDKAVEVLANFHNVGKKFKTNLEFNSKPLDSETSDITKFNIDKHNPKYNHTSILKRLRISKTKFAKKVLNDVDLIQELIVSIIEYLYLNETNFSQKTLLHYDFNKDNLLYKDGEFFAVTDFEYSHIGYIETDVTKAAKYWSEDFKNKNIDIKKFKLFIKKYNQFNSIPLDWNLYYYLLIYIILRRLMYSIENTIEKKVDLEFLYDVDITLIKIIIKNKQLFCKN